MKPPPIEVRPVDGEEWSRNKFRSGAITRSVEHYGLEQAARKWLYLLDGGHVLDASRTFEIRVRRG